MSTSARAELDARSGGVAAPSELGSQLPSDRNEYGLTRVRLGGKRVSARVTQATQSIQEVETMDGASTFTMVLYDQDGELERSGLFDSAVDLRVLGVTAADDRMYRLVKVQSQPPMLTLQFEDRDVAFMRQHNSFRRASRAKVTRLQFIVSMVREVKKRRIPVFAPEVKLKQPIAKQDQQAKRKSRGGKGHRFPAGADITVKGGKASSAQLKVLDDVLEQGMDQGATRRGLIGAVMCVTVESEAKNMAGGDLDSVGAFQQRKSQGWPATRVVKTDARAFYKAFLPSVKANPGADLGTLVANVQKPREDLRGEYAKWQSEATKTVDAWLGEEGADGDGGGTYTKRYEFRRGEPGKKEDTWAAAGRLVDEVRFRRFMRRGELWLVSENWLSKQRCKVSWSRRSQGVQSISYEYDSGKQVTSATVTAFAAAGLLLAGDGVILKDMGKAANGRYLVSTITRDHFSPLITYELKRRTVALPEPAAETATRSSDGTSTGGTGGATGSLDWPTDPHPVTSGFGARSSPGGIGSTNHDGIDIGVPVGTSVKAADGGKVTVAGVQGGYGNYVEIDHGGGVVTFYGHLSKILVRAGQKVAQGDEIAKSGNTGNSTGPHLHFGVHVRGAKVDPRTKLRG